MTRPVLLWWGIGAILAAMVLGAALTAAGPDLPRGLDTAWNQLMVSIRSAGLIEFAEVMNYLGAGWVATILTPIIVIVLLLSFRRWRDAILVAVTLIASVAAVQLLKSLFGRARPVDMLVASDFGSFPSGHTANAATLAMLAILLFPRLWVVLVAAAWTLAMAFSRTALSVHWLTDTVGGMLVGSGVALIVGAIMLSWVRQPRMRQETP